MRGDGNESWFFLVLPLFVSRLGLPLPETRGLTLKNKDFTTPVLNDITMLDFSGLDDPRSTGIWNLLCW